MVTHHSSPYGPPVSPGPADPSSRRRRRRGFLTAAVIAGLVAISAIAAVRLLLPDGPRSVNITGTMILADNDPTGTNFTWDVPGQAREICTGYEGYSDIAEGTSVTIKDSSGKIVAVSRLSQGLAGGFGEDPVLADGAPTRCTFPFTAPNVPADDFYSVEVSHRGTVTFSREQVTTGPIELTTGTWKPGR